MDLFPHRRRLRLLLLALGLGLGASLYAQPLQVIWDRSGQQDSSAYGYRILPLGDQNSDGYADWAVWAHGGGTDPGYLEFFHGGNPPSTAPYMTFHNGPAGVWWMFNLGVVGDVNGDSFVDWYISRRYAADLSHQVVGLYFGGPQADTIADWTLATLVSDWVGNIGDYNGDGFSDLYVYHYLAGFGQAYFGGSPMDTMPDWSKHDAPGYQDQAFPIGFGDLNGDGYSDFVSETYPLYTTHIFLGSANPDTVPTYTWLDLPSWPEGIVNDMNGDGFDELVYGPREHAELHFGGQVLHSTADVVLNFPCRQGSPAFVTDGGDVNRDGYHDLILISEYCLDSEWGTLSLYLGHPWIYSEPALTIRGWTAPLNLIGIWTAAGVGDVDGDGIDDIAIGAFSDNIDIGFRGRVVILAGDSAWRAGVAEARPEMPNNLQVSVYPNPFNAVATISYAVPKAGEVSVKVFDVTGRLVKILCEGRREAGEQAVGFEGKGLASGVYFVCAKMGAESRVVKVMLLK